MNIILIIQYSLKVSGYTIIKKIESNNYIDWWFWVSIAEFLVIVFLIFRTIFNKKNTFKQKMKKKSLEQDIDFDNIINSSFSSDKLYDKLKVKCHPDRFPDNPEKNNNADKLFQQITENRNNVKKLLELKDEAIKKLNINF
jgi:hypothetical protein